MIFSSHSVYVDDIVITFNPKSMRTSFQGELVFVILMSLVARDKNYVFVSFNLC